MVRRLLGREPADWREHAERVACEHDDVTRLAVDDAGDARVRDVLDRVGAARVLRDGDVVVVRDTRLRVVHDVFEDRAEADGVEDLGLLLSREVDRLGVAPALDVEDTSVGPDVLVVANEETVGVSRKCGLAGSGKTEEESDGAIDANIGRGVKGKLTELDWLKVVLVASGLDKRELKAKTTITYHDGEDTLLHLSGILGTEDDHLHALEIDLDGSSRRHALSEAICRELSSVVDYEVRFAELEQLLLRRPNEHVVLT